MPDERTRAQLLSGLSPDEFDRLMRVSDREFAEIAGERSAHATATLERVRRRVGQMGWSFDALCYGPLAYQKSCGVMPEHFARGRIDGK